MLFISINKVPKHINAFLYYQEFELSKIDEIENDDHAISLS